MNLVFFLYGYVWEKKIRFLLIFYGILEVYKFIVVVFFFFVICMYVLNLIYKEKLFIKNRIIFILLN